MPAYYGKCTSKNFLITKNWKCVDFRQPPDRKMDEQNRVSQKCRDVDWFDVCPMCRFFKDLKDLTDAEIQATINHPQSKARNR